MSDRNLKGSISRDRMQQIVHWRHVRFDSKGRHVEVVEVDGQAAIETRSRMGGEHEAP